MTDPRLPLEQAFGTPEAKRRYTRRLFATIADRYDVITRVLSFGRDQKWKLDLIERAGVLPGTRALDLACGTGDLALLAASRGASVVGLDFTARMIELAQRARPASGARGDVPRTVARWPAVLARLQSSGIRGRARRVPDVPDGGGFNAGLRPP